MKIFFYSPTLRPGGAEKQCSLVASGLKKYCGCECTILLNYGDRIKDEYARFIQDAGVSVILLPATFAKRIQFLFTLFKCNQDAVLFNYLTYPDFWGGLVARIAGLKLVVGGIETDRMFGKKFIAEYIAHKLFSWRTICNSYRAFEFFSSRGFSRDRMIVMPSGIVPIQSTLRDKTKPNSICSIITVGRFVPAKDYITWITVFAKVHSLRPHVQGTIIGYGEQEALVRNLIEQAKLKDAVRILSGLTTNVVEELNKHELYLTTSEREGTSNTVLEAMNAEMPVVATNVGDNAHMITNGVSGFICPVKDVDALSKALIELIDNYTLRSEMGKNAKKKILEEYSINVILSRYMKLIKSAI